MRKIGFAFCFIWGGLWMFLTWISSSVTNPTLFFLQYGIMPAFVILFMLTRYSSRTERGKGLTDNAARIFIAIYVVVMSLFGLLVIFVMPNIRRSVQETINLEDLQKRIEKNYSTALAVNNIEEMSAYYDMYKFYFPESDFDFSTLTDLEKVLSQAQTKDMDYTVSDTVTALNYLSIDRRGLEQRIADYVADAKFFAAQLLLINYKSRYVTNKRIQDLEVLINEHIENNVTSYSEQMRIQLQRQIQYLYDILARPIVNTDTITAYYQVMALNNGYVNDLQLEWLYNAFTTKLKSYVFFTHEARIALLKKTNDVSITL